MRRQTRAAIQSTLLLIGSLLVALLFCEGMARVYSYLVDDAEKDAPARSPVDVALLRKYFDIPTLLGARLLERPVADRYVSNIAIAKGVDRAWFQELPDAPDRDPKNVDPQDAALQDEYIKRGHYGPQSFYIWNEQFVRAQVCDGSDKLFDNLPNPVKVFQSPDGRPNPIYRFPPNGTLPSGLKTNRYGFRGPDFPQERSPNTIRIAFVGSSETIADHSFPFSYPEYFGIWLNKWLAENSNGLRAEIINAGREGIGTTDVAAVLEQEVLPLAPDYVIFYDGANQLGNARSLGTAPGRVQGFTLEQALRGPRLLPDSWAAHSRFAKLVNDSYQLYLAPTLDDWRRPNYVFGFPAAINEAKPEIDDPNLPLGLSGFLSDLKTMTNATRAAGVPFMISTLVWLDGSELTPGNPDQAAIRALLKSMFWPLKPAEIRRLINFSNRTLREFAKSTDIGLLEIANEFPHDPDLFTDAYHMRPEGLKLLAWIGLQHFLPQLMQDLHNGKLGKTPEVSLRLPLPAGDDFPFDCRPTSEALAQARSIALESMTLGAEGAFLRPTSSGVAFRSLPDPWAYIGRMPLDAGCVAGGGWVAADIRVTRGAVGIGVLNRNGDEFLVQSAGEIVDGLQTVFLRLDSFAAAGDLVLRNWDEKSPSEGVLQAVRIVAEGGKTPASCDSHLAPAATPIQKDSRPAPVSSAPATDLPLTSLQPQNERR